MNKLYIALNAILGQAYDDGLIATNPMSRVKAPRPDTPERHALDADGVGRLLDALSRLELDGRVMAVYLMLYAGLRRSEALALEPADISGGMVHVHQAINERNGNIGQTKTPSAVRRVPAPAPLLEVVDDWMAMRAAIGHGSARTLCTNTRGGILRPQYLQRWWAGDGTHNAMRDALGFPGLDLHELRHTNLTMMARHMTIYDLKTYAGWSSIEPARVYIHDDMSAVRRAVDDAWCGSSAPDLHQ
jgi:integrase